MATQKVPKRTNKFEAVSVIEPNLAGFLNHTDQEGKKVIAIVHKGQQDYNHEYLVVSLKSDVTFEDVEVADMEEELAELTAPNR
jgi:hypothetical protein